MHVETLLALARQLADRIHTVEEYGTGGCPTCRDGEARAFLAQLRQLAAGPVAPGGAPAKATAGGYLESDSA